ncbi:MAG: VWA domain-containing protein [Pseudomonadota bacterium]
MTIGDLQFGWPWLALIVGLPLLVRLALPQVRRDAGALRLPDADYFAPLSNDREPPPWLAIVPAVLFWLLLVVAAMRPQMLGDEVSAPATGRNLMLAVDLSGSMDVNDFTLRQQRVNRLLATKAVAGEFIDRRAGDRIGLILFGERAYLQVPLTFDRKTVQTLLFEAAVGLAGEKTAIGDAIGLAIKRLRAADNEEGKQVLVLLTDGANTAGRIDPLKAAELAAANDLRIYTIGIGAERMDIPSSLTGRIQRVNPSTDLDEQTLRSIAEMTGGTYFRATDTRTLEEIYQKLDELEPAASDEQGYRPVIDLYVWPLAGALAVLAIVVLAQTAKAFTSRQGAAH